MVCFSLLCRICAVIGLCALAGCATAPNNTAEDWLTVEKPTHAWTPIDPDRRIVISASAIPAAVAALGQHEAIQLDPETFARLAPGHEWPAQSGRVPYLVRGVALDSDRGSLNVLEGGNELLVQYEGPRATARAYCQPVIVLLPAAPAKLFVRISLFT